MKLSNIRTKVYDFKTKYKEGFTYSEIEALVKLFPDMEEDKFHEAMRCNTGKFIDGEVINYHCDVERAIRCGVENRELKSWEWD